MWVCVRGAGVRVCLVNECAKEIECGVCVCVERESGVTAHRL